MQELEPHYNWRHIYMAEEDERSPFYGRVYSEFEYSNAIYNYYIHPQWDYFGSKTLYAKILYADYELQVAIIELIGEWNDAIENDISTLKAEIIYPLLLQGITHYILIAENVLNYHSGEKDYYEELFDELYEQAGWAVILNLSQAAQYEFKQQKLNHFIELMQIEDWRSYKPHHLFRKINDTIQKRLE